MRTLIVLLGLVSALAILEMGWALKCYECKTIGEPHCDSANKKECKPGVKSCWTGTFKDEKEGVSNVVKDCGPEYDAPSGCKTRDQVTNCFCTGDLCNADASNS
ncbi:hypothetical protein M3Y95_00998000 [Aphelenchoides besseyi]|nr:hypothetical protein M3Y95_00998000 [Aphelenchoides besseyi]